MRSAFDWLPDDALAAPALLQVIDAGLAVWSTRWFSTDPVGRSGTPAMTAAAVRPAWCRFGPGIWIEWTAQSRRSLALHALGSDDRNARTTTADHHLLELLGERIARDLAAGLLPAAVQTVAERGGDAAAGDITATMTFSLRNASRTVNLPVAVDRGRLATVRKALCPAYTSKAVEPLPLAAALGGISVPFDVALGRARIGLLDLQALEAGDTVVLDQPIAAPVAVRASETGTTIGRAELRQEEGQPKLIVS